MPTLDHHSFAAVAAAVSSVTEDDDAAASITFPLIRLDYGGAVASRFQENTVHVSYCGPQPYGARELGELFAAVGECLAAARNARLIVESLRLEASFVDPTEDDEEGDDWGDEGADFREPDDDARAADLVAEAVRRYFAPPPVDAAAQSEAAK